MSDFPANSAIRVELCPSKGAQEFVAAITGFPGEGWRLKDFSLFIVFRGADAQGAMGLQRGKFGLEIHTFMLPACRGADALKAHRRLGAVLKMCGLTSVLAPVDKSNRACRVMCQAMGVVPEFEEGERIFYRWHL